ncbi:MAG: ABC transporter ATP-binding protein, partial [Actinobacteria bacterium HGW-Actinobacteria-8]
EEGATFEVDAEHLGAVLAELTTFGVLALTSSPPTLEDLFLRHYGDELAMLAGNGGTS